MPSDREFLSVSFVPLRRRAWCAYRGLTCDVFAKYAQVDVDKNKPVAAPARAGDVAAYPPPPLPILVRDTTWLL